MKRILVFLITLTVLGTLFSCTKQPAQTEKPLSDPTSTGAPAEEQSQKEKPQEEAVPSLPENVDEMDVACEDGYTYTISVKDGKATLIRIKYGTYWSKESDEPLVLPDTLAGYPVTVIGGSAFYRLQAKEVVLPECLEEIKGGFYRCSATKLFIPKNVKKIGGDLSYKAALSEIAVDEENEYFTAQDGVLYDKEIKTLISFPEGKKVEEYEVPESVTAIDSNAFGRFVRMKRLIIGEQVTDVPETLFGGTTNFDTGFTLVVKEGSAAHTFAQAYLSENIVDHTEVLLEVV